MERINYDKVNEKLYNFIYEEDGDFISFDELFLSERLCDIMLNNFDFKNYLDEPDFVKVCDLEKTKKCSYEFLKILKPAYAEKMLESINEGILKFIDYSGTEVGIAGLNNGKKEVIVPLRYDLSDMFILTHEQIHDTILNEGELTPSWSYFSETPTITAEFLQADYLGEKIGKKETKKYLKFSMTGCAYRALVLKTEILLLKEIMLNGNISKISLVEIISTIHKICHDDYLTSDAIDDALSNLLEEKEVFYFFNLRYIVGMTLSSYVHDKILENPKLLSEFAKYNENFKYLDIEQVFQSLDLEFDDTYLFNLNDESYEKLEKSYKKELKRIGW